MGCKQILSTLLLRLPLNKPDSCANSKKSGTTPVKETAGGLTLNLVDQPFGNWKSTTWQSTALSRKSRLNELVMIAISFRVWESYAHLGDWHCEKRTFDVCMESRRWVCRTNLFRPYYIPWLRPLAYRHRHHHSASRLTWGFILDFWTPQNGHSPASAQSSWGGIIVDVPVRTRCGKAPRTCCACFVPWYAKKALEPPSDMSTTDTD